MKKLSLLLGGVLSFSILLGGCALSNDGVKGVVNKDLIELSENAQYLPSRELLVAEHGTSKTSAAFSTRRSNDVSPELLLSGGLSEDDYDALIDNISPIDTPFNHDFTVSDAKTEVTKVLSSGVKFNEWFGYQEGDLAGSGKYLVTNNDDALTITRLSSFQPWIYDAETNTFPWNGDFESNIPNYPIRSDNYLKISIYTEDGKEVVECEVVENLSYYGNVTPASYQFMRNVKDTSFTKIQLKTRAEIRHPEGNGKWGYDIDTLSDYGYMRSFTQLDYSDPNNIKWLEASQELPYAFNLRAESRIEFGSRSAEGGFSYSLHSVHNDGQFSYQPSEEYLTVDCDKVIYMNSTARMENFENYNKNFWIEDGERNFYVTSLTEEAQNAFNGQIGSVLISLKALANSAAVSSQITSYDCTARNTDFEEAFSAYFNAAAKAAIDGSALAKDYLNNNVYESTAVSLIPV
ncbi:MAG: hypothetical protein K2K04_01575 [Clostridia bacterium]|nr:hypothetical protein [Clostridia bacterium]